QVTNGLDAVQCAAGFVDVREVRDRRGWLLFSVLTIRSNVNRSNVVPVTKKVLNHSASQSPGSTGYRNQHSRDSFGEAQYQRRAMSQEVALEMPIPVWHGQVLLPVVNAR